MGTVGSFAEFQQPNNVTRMRSEGSLCASHLSDLLSLSPTDRGRGRLMAQSCSCLKLSTVSKKKGKKYLHK